MAVLDYFFAVPLALSQKSTRQLNCISRLNIQDPKIFLQKTFFHKLKDRITPHVTNFFKLRLTIEKQEGKGKYKSDGAVMVSEFVCMYVCSCTVSE